MKSIIYLDMDGVLADFEGWAANQVGPDWQEEIQQDTWGKFKDYPNIYSLLPVMDGAKELYEKTVEFVGGDVNRVQILTALPNRAAGAFPDAVKDKIWWAHTYISPHIRVHFGPFAKHKCLHVKHAHDVLIDDMERNIKQWNAAGGIGILHKNTTDSLNALHNAIHNGIK